MTAQCPGPEGAFDLSRIAIEAAAKLADLRPQLPLRFCFDWQGIAFAGRVDDGTPPRLRLTGDLGPLPFSAEDAARRRAALALRGRRVAPRFHATTGNRLTFWLEQPIAAPRDSLSLITAITLALLGLRVPLDTATPLLVRH